jgi:transposase
VQAKYDMPGLVIRPWRAHLYAGQIICNALELVERFFNKLKHFRAVATRYDKRDDNYLAAIKLASARIWMRFNESMT